MGMHTITVNNDRAFFFALQKANRSKNLTETIELKPGKYFADADNIFLSIKKNITIKGLYDNAKATNLNCAFLMGADTTLILENLTMNYFGEKSNTIALYDGAELYGNNIIVDRTMDQNSNWDTIYCKDSTISLKNSEILTDPIRNICGLSLENSQLIAVNSNVNAPLFKNSTVYLKDTLTSYSVVLKNHSNLSFINLAIDSTQNTEFSDFYIENQSTVNGVNLNFSKKDSFVDVIDSHFENNNFVSGLENVRWRFTDNSTVLADGDEPFNDNL